MIQGAWLGFRRTIARQKSENLFLALQVKDFLH